MNLATRTLILAAATLCALWAQAANMQPQDLSRLRLTDEERAWLAQHREIRVAVNHGWAPIGFLSETNEAHGISVDYLKRLEAMLGIRFTQVRSVEDPSIEQADVLSAVSNIKTLSNSRFVALDEPYMRMPFVIFARHDTTGIHQLQDLYGKRVAVFKTGVAAESLARDHPGIQLYKADIAEEALNALVSGKVDAYVGNLIVISYVARNQGYGNIKVVGQAPPYESSVYMAVRSDWPELRSILQKALNALTPEEREVILRNWSGITYEHDVNYALLLGVGGTALTVIALFGFWNWRLKIVERARADRRERARNQVLELLSRGAPLSEILHSIVHSVEQEDPNMLCSILLLDHESKHLLTGAAPSLPDTYNQAIHGVEVGMGVGSCGTAAYLGTRVVVENIATHPYWKDYKHLAERAGLSSCWSEPIKNANGVVVGSFAIYHREAARPSEGDIYLIEQAAHLAGVAIDRGRTNEELQLALLVYQNSSEAMMVTDAEGRILTINAAFSALTGWQHDEVASSPTDADISFASYHIAIWDKIQDSTHWQGEAQSRRRNGETYTAWLTVNTISNAENKVHRRVALFYDITEKKKSEELIWQQANFDTLTGLPNRRMLLDRLEQEVKKAHRAGLPMALLFIDLDRFKEINDTLGHSMGDLLLKQAAQRLETCVRESDTVARLGGDEFTVLLGELDEPNCIERVAQAILYRLAEPFDLEGELVYVSASIGITLYPTDATESGTLLKNADQAMYAAKQLGRNRCSYFTHSMQEAAQMRMRIANDLRGALAGEQFLVHYQPIVDLATGAIRKAEALLRWEHPHHGMINPAEFIPVAEETGMIVEIGDFVFFEAVRQCARWRASHDPEFQVSINKSPIQFRSDRANLNWADQLAVLGLPGQSIVVEITEGLLLDANTVVTNKLLRFRDAGIQVSLDDFGTGYSSLSYLQRYDIDYLKIDQSFVRNLVTGSANLALCEAIIVMAHKLKMRVVAEGVETEAQRDMLVAAGCDFAQGYLFSRPLPAEQFEVLLHSQPATTRSLHRRA